MDQLKVYHHFREDLIPPKERVAKYERYIVDTLLNSKVHDLQRESSICWELKHQASTVQFAKILALKRGLPIDVCIVGLLLHDIESIIHGKYESHAHKGTKIAAEILTQLGGFSEQEKKQIKKIIYHHSDKHVWTKDPFKEIGKDVDVLDCFLYDGAFGFYLGNKPLPIFKNYLKRAKKIWEELGLPQDIRFNILDGYNDHWFQKINTFPLNNMKGILTSILILIDIDKKLGVCPPPFCIVKKDASTNIYGNRNQWKKFIDNFLEISDLPISKEELNIISSLLIKTFKIGKEKEPTNTIDSNLETILQQHYKKARKILGNGKNKKHSEQGFLFWPLVDIYEKLEGKKISLRLKEVGVKI